MPLAMCFWGVPTRRERTIAINRLCASGMAAAAHASRMLHMGDAEVLIAGGVEHMTRGPWVLSKASQPFGRDSQLHDSSFGWRFINPRMEALYGTEGMGQTAENLVDLHEISREDQDAFACWSQEKAALHAATRHAECMSVEIPQRKKDALILSVDEFAKPGTTVEALEWNQELWGLGLFRLQTSLCRRLG